MLVWLVLCKKKIYICFVLFLLNFKLNHRMSFADIVFELNFIKSLLRFYSHRNEIENRIVNFLSSAPVNLNETRDSFDVETAPTATAASFDISKAIKLTEKDS